MSDFTGYQSPFSWRYGSELMRSIWSEYNKRLIWRKLWVALAEAESKYGLVSPEQLVDLQNHVLDIDIPWSLEVEDQIKHDLMAEIKVFASQCPEGGGIIHLGATSMDIKDNADAIQIKQSLKIVLEELKNLLVELSKLIEKTADLPVMAFTHLQPAEPTTLGYRLASFAQDLLDDYQSLSELEPSLKGKGFKGAVGNAASYIELVGENHFTQFEQSISDLVGLPFFEIATQTYTRRQDFVLLSQLACLAATLGKFALDLRLLQSQPIGELSEPFGSQQVGSSAMPFKRNPIQAEKIDSLARLVASAPQTAWQNAVGSLLERTLDDSANRRTILPETFLATDEMIITMTRILAGLKINEKAIQRTLKTYAPFAGIERLLMELVKNGADRQKMHECMRRHSLAAWECVNNGEPNPLVNLLGNDPEITQYIKKEDVQKSMKAETYIGMAACRSREISKKINLKLMQ